MNKYLIAGGLGAIGKNLVNSLISYNECSILIIDNLSSENLDYASYYNKYENVNVEILDISNYEKLVSIVLNYEPNIIFHLAAHFANQNSVDYIYSDINTNIIGTINLLESARRLDCLEKFIYASSSCVYGNSALMAENDPIFPYDTPYAINKYVGEMYMKYYYHHYNLPTVSVRIFNTYGPFDLPGKYRNFIPNLVKAAFFNNDIVITGDGNETRDFTFVTDTCDLLILASQYYGEYDVFNSGTGIGTSISELVSMVIDKTSSNSITKYGERRNWDSVSHRKSDIQKAKLKLSYNPSVILSKGLDIYMDWFKSTYQK
jgi:nucleoside-diphosphate-sugar epimerase